MTRKDLKEGDIVDSMFDAIDFKKPNIFKKILYKIKYSFNCFKGIFVCFFQKRKYGFKLVESFDFFSCHAEWCLPRLKFLRKNLNGHPRDLTEVEWEDILDKIIYSFENIENEPGLDYPENYDYRYRVYFPQDGEIGFESMDSRTPGRNSLDAFNQKIDEGLFLFAKYYRDLWD